MVIVIIEDDEVAYKRLCRIILELLPGSEVTVVLKTVQLAIDWLGTHRMPDLIFMEINLGDASGFEIFKAHNITCPVIFTTAHREFAMQAFKVNSIDYLLKPIDRPAVQRALDKLMLIKAPGLAAINGNGKLHRSYRNSYRERLVVKKGDAIKSVPVDEIAYFFTENKTNWLCTNSGEKYPVEYNLEQIADMVNPRQYFRINRQFIIGLDAIEEMKTYTRARVIVKLRPECHIDTIVSVERSGNFRAWLSGEMSS
jgi:two-component system LytT family response regulator